MRSARLFSEGGSLRWIGLALLLLICLPPLLPALDRAENPAEEGGVDALLARYREVNDWRLAYNIGVAFLERDQSLQAKVWFLKAWRNSLGEETTARALRYLEQWFPRSPESPLQPLRFRERWGLFLLRLLPNAALKGAGIVLALLLSAVLCWGFRFGWGRLRTHLLLALILLTLLWGGGLGLRLWDSSHPRLGLVVRETWVTSAPSSEGTPLVMIAPGQEVGLMERKGAWVQVKWGEYAGWAPLAGLELVP